MTITRHAFNVADTFVIKGRGLLITMDKPYDELRSWLVLHIGDEILFRSGGNCVRAKVTGFHFHGPDLIRLVLSVDLPKCQVPIGCEVWVTKSSIVKPVEEK